MSGIERGVRNPTLEIIVEISHGLGLKPADLMATIGSRCDVDRADPKLTCRVCRDAARD